MPTGPRQCDSDRDNDCDGHPDNVVDDVCQCVPGTEGEFLHLVDFGAAPDLVLRASLPIEGYGRQLLVHDGVAFVFSSVSAPEGGAPGLPRPPGYVAYFDKLTVIDTRAEPASVLREVYFEGALAGPVQRRGERALLTLQQPVKVRVDYPRIEPLDVFGRPRSRERVMALLEAWAAVREDSIAASTLADFLPFTYERRGDELVQLPFACTSSLVPARGLGASSFTRLVALDLPRPASRAAARLLERGRGVPGVDGVWPRRLLAGV